MIASSVAEVRFAAEKIGGSIVETAPASVERVVEAMLGRVEGTAS